MPRAIIIPDVQQLTDHYLRQQRGGNIAGFRGTHMQRGYGIGGIFRSLARFARLLFKKSAESVGKQALKAATEVGKDVLDGKSFKESTNTVICHASNAESYYMIQQTKNRENG